MKRSTVAILIVYFAVIFAFTVAGIMRACADEGPATPTTRLGFVGCDATCLHHRAPAKLLTGDGSTYDLPPGYTVPEDRFSALDRELRRLQEVETRVTAENKSLRKSAKSVVRWPAIGVAVVAGLLVGVAVGSAL